MSWPALVELERRFPEAASDPLLRAFFYILLVWSICSFIQMKFRWMSRWAPLMVALLVTIISHWSLLVHRPLEQDIVPVLIYAALLFINALGLNAALSIIQFHSKAKTMGGQPIVSRRTVRSHNSLDRFLAHW